MASGHERPRPIADNPGAAWSRLGRGSASSPRSHPARHASNRAPASPTSSVSACLPKRRVTMATSDWRPDARHCLRTAADRPVNRVARTRCICDSHRSPPGRCNSAATCTYASTAAVFCLGAIPVGCSVTARVHELGIPLALTPETAGCTQPAIARHCCQGGTRRGRSRALSGRTRLTVPGATRPASRSRNPAVPQQDASSR